jgi:hypothetical protein
MIEEISFAVQFYRISVESYLAFPRSLPHLAHTARSAFSSVLHDVIKCSWWRVSVPMMGGCSLLAAMSRMISASPRALRSR